ncbi:MAG: CinA family protein [Chloroflexi bacterium]|nr:CinA family protein [Chloroflexota bacterium]
MAEIDDLAAAVAERLKARGETVAVAESASGGLISAALLGVAGASAYYKGGAVVYTADGAHWAIAETGAAGPTGNRYGDAAGHAALAVSGPLERTQIVETGESDRRRNMDAFALAALRLLHDALTAAE